MGDGLRRFGIDIEPQAAVTCASGDTVPGIDVSKWQGTINWTKVAGAGVKFAIIRVSDGKNTIDAKFESNWAGAKAQGIVVGAYQFFRPSQDPIVQADILLDKMGTLQPGDLPPVIDVEDNGGMSSSAVAAAVKKWIDHVEAATGVKPIVYTGRYFWQDYVKSTAWSDYNLWIAHYTNGCPNIPSQWSNWAMHQYSESGSVPGISGGVDMNRFNGTYDDLLALTGTDGGDDGGDACGIIPADGATIDDGDACYKLEGPAQYWRHVAAGVGGDLAWTGTVVNTSTNSATVDLFFDTAGTYRIEANIVPGYGTSHNAIYKVQHAGGSAQVVMNQSTKDGWVSLGTFAFDAGGGQQITLADKTGEANSLGRRVCLDAFRITPVDPQQSEAPSQDDDGVDAPLDLDRGGAESCSVQADGRPSPWMLLLTPVLAAARRRRRAQRSAR